MLGALFLVHPRPQVFDETDDTSVLKHFREAGGSCGTRTALWLPILMIGMVSFLGTSVIQLAPALAKDEFHVGAARTGSSLPAFGLGAVDGLGRDRVHRRPHEPLVRRPLGIVGLSIGVAALGLAPRYGIRRGRDVLHGVTYLLLATSLNTGVQARVEDEFRGRAMAIYLSSLLLGVPVGALIQGKLAQVVDLRVVVVASGVGLLAFALYTMLRYSWLHPLDESLADMRTDPLLRGQAIIAGAD